jgi:hypothetical protein
MICTWADSEQNTYDLLFTLKNDDCEYSLVTSSILGPAPPTCSRWSVILHPLDGHMSAPAPWYIIFAMVWGCRGLPGFQLLHPVIELINLGKLVVVEPHDCLLNDVLDVLLIISIQKTSFIGRLFYIHRYPRIYSNYNRRLRTRTDEYMGYLI